MVKEKLHKFIGDPNDPINNFELGKSYYDIKHYPSAFNYFLRTAELTEDKVLAYHSLIFCALCLKYQGNRKFATIGFFMQAKALLPMRPEANYLYARLLLEHHDWAECYAECRSSTVLCDYSPEPLKGIGYHGIVGFQLLQSISGWRTGKKAECREIVKKIHENYVIANSDIDESLKLEIKNHAIELKVVNPTVYAKTFHEKLKYKFPGSELIEKNYSETYQDLMAISVHNGKRNGTYLEIGSCRPYGGNNTALLEETFDWRGVSVDIDERFVNEFNNARKNKAILHDGTTLNYAQVLKAMDFPTDIDYLQLDCDPPNITYDILLKIPFDKYRFGFITYEHDFYSNKNLPYRDWSRSYLIDKGYVPIASDVAVSWDRTKSYEDWWIHPELISPKTFQKLKAYGDGPKISEEFLFD